MDDRPAEHSGPGGAGWVSVRERGGHARCRGCALAVSCTLMGLRAWRLARAVEPGPDAGVVRFDGEQHGASPAHGRDAGRANRSGDVSGGRRAGESAGTVRGRLCAGGGVRHAGVSSAGRDGVGAGKPQAVSRAGAEGIAQIIPRWHPSMRGRTFDPFASLEYAANLMASHIDHRGGDYRGGAGGLQPGLGFAGEVPGRGVPLRRLDSGRTGHGDKPRTG